LLRLTKHAGARRLTVCAHWVSVAVVLLNFLATRQFICDDLALLSSEVKELHVYAKLDGFDAVSFVIDISFENQFHPTDVDFEDVSGRYDVVELALSFADVLSVQVDFEAFDLQRCLQNSHKLWHFILLIEEVP